MRQRITVASKEYELEFSINGWSLYRICKHTGQAESKPIPAMTRSDCAKFPKQAAKEAQRLWKQHQGN